MKVLIVCARTPDAGGKGDQQRALQLAELLAPDHDVELWPITATGLRRAAGALAGAARGLPLQVGWMAPPGAARELARAAADADVAVVVTIRCLRERLPVPTMLDHVDALSLSMRERARLERRLAVRVGALVEARLLRRHERRAAGWVAAQTVVSPLDAAALPRTPRPVVLPLVFDLAATAPDAADTPASRRDIDVVMTGDMRYPPNRDGAIWLATQIVPALRDVTAPDLRVVIAGRGARTLPNLGGIELMSDVPDIGALLRRSKVAAVPLRGGTGTPIKLLEAVAAGAAPVSTPWVATAHEVELDTAADAGGFAAAIARLLADPELRRRRVQAARAGLESHSAAAVAGRLRALLDQIEPVRSRE